MNAMPPNASFDRIRPTPLWALRFVRNSWYWFHYFCHWTPEQRRTFIQRKLRTCRKRIASVLGFGDSLGARDLEDHIDLSLYPEDQQKLWDIHLRASAQYHPRPYAGHITVLRTRFHPFLCSFDPTFGWGEFAQGGVTTKIVAGAHESILAEPHASDAASALQQCLRASQESSTPTTLPAQLHHLGRMIASSVLWLVDLAPAL